MKEMEKAIQAYKEGTCQLSDALNATMKAVFSNKSYFGLEKLDEDSFSDFLIYLRERLPRFIDMYDPERSKFRTYIRKICLTLLRSWYRKFYREYARDMALTTYAIEEGLYDGIAEDTEELFTADCPDENTDSVRNFLKQTNKKVPVQTKIMMLALKSASFLTASHIQKICELAEISEDELYKKLDIINQKLDSKLERQKHMIQLQNEAYILKKESAIQLSFLHPGTSHFRTAEISHSFNDKLWKSRMEKTRSTHDVYPTNQMVSEVLNVPLGQVTHVFSAVRHKVGSVNAKNEVSCTYDNVCSDRECPQTERTDSNSDPSSDKNSKR